LRKSRSRQKQQTGERCRRQARKPRAHRYTEGGTVIHRPARVVYHSLQ
jgi:hypothetical protein